MNIISSFQGEHRFLSNFWGVTITTDDDLTFRSTEAAYQAAKTVNPLIRDRFTFMTAGEAKRAGRSIQIRPDWDAVKLDVMTDLTARKFTLGDELSQLLLATGDAQLIEGNHWGDRFWGVCKGIGQNHLGRILMERRNFLRANS